MSVKGKRKLKYRIRSILYRRPNALPVYHYIFGSGCHKYCCEETDICIEGYPSTANTFVYNVFSRKYNNKRISHHTHSIANIKRAINYGIPTIILCRKPKEAVASRCIRFDIDTREALLQYAEFYKYVNNVRSKLLISGFKKSTYGIERLLKDFEIFSGLNVDDNESIFEVKERVKEHINVWSKRNKKSKSMPDKDRESKKKVIKRRIVGLDEYKICREVHSRIVSTTEAP